MTKKTKTQNIPCPRCGNLVPITVDVEATFGISLWIAFIMLWVGGMIAGWILHMGMTGCG